MEQLNKWLGKEVIRLIGSMSITFMVIQGILAIGVPVFCFIYFKKKHHISWKPVLVGVLIFVLFANVLEPLLHQYILETNTPTKVLFQNPYLYAIYGGLAAGIFEETGRYMGFYFLLKKYRDWKDGVAYGIGHGGIEAILIGGMASVSLIANTYLLNTGELDSLIQSKSGNTAENLLAVKDQLVNTPAFMYFVSGLERAFAFTHHLAFSLIVLYGIRIHKIQFLFYAILAHALIDFVAGLYQAFQFNFFIVESFNGIVAILAVIFIIKSKSLFQNQQGPYI